LNLFLENQLAKSPVSAEEPTADSVVHILPNFLFMFMYLSLRN